MDDLPVGQTNNNDKFNEGPAAEKNNADADKPIEERLISKNWSTRADAYKEIQDQFKKAPSNCANESFRDYASKWSNFLADANPGSLEKAIEAFQSYLDRAKSDLVSQLQISVLKTLVDKCLGHTKPTIKAKSLECVLSIFEIAENFDLDTQDAIEELCKSKQIKTQMTAIGLLASLITAFGVKKFPIARYQVHIEAMANHSTPAARTEAMNCYKAMYLWLGDAVTSFMDKLKPAQKETVVKEFPEHKEKNKVFKRLTRTEKAKAKEAELDAIIAEETKEEVVDVYEIAPSSKILAIFTAEWIEATLALKKWDEKRDKMIELTTAADVAKLESGSYGDLAQLVKKFLTDSNVVVSQNAIKAVGALAKGLRQQFQTLAKELFPVLLGRFKEKRLCEDVQLALTKILMCLDLNELMESIPASLKDKSPEVKKQVLIFLERALQTTYIDQLEEIQAELLPAVQSATEEKDNDIREQGIKTFGILLGRLGEQVLLKYTDGVIPQKKTKIEEAAASVKPSKFDKSQKKAAATALVAKKKPEVKKQVLAKAQPKKSADAAQENLDEQPSDVISTSSKAKTTQKPKVVNDEPMDFPAYEKPALKKPPPNIGQKPPAKPATTTAAPKPAGKAPVAQSSKDEDEGSGLSKEEAIEKVTEFYDAANVAKFDEADWKLKVEGFKGLQQQIEELKPDAVMLEATARFIKAKMKDWKESNMNLMKETVETLKKMTECCERIPKRALWVYGPFLTDKIGDVKFSTTIKELLMTLADFVTAKFVAQQVIKYGVTAKAPNNIKESCLVLTSLLEVWGAGHMPVKDCIDFSTLAANNPNVQVRNSSMQLFAGLFKHLGETVRSFLTDIKESTMKLIEEEFKKVTPYKKGEFKSSRELKGEAQEEMGAAGAAPVDFQDSLPREDISKQLNAKLLALFKDKDWKKRKEAADGVIEILKAAKMRIEPNGVGELMEALKGAMKEANKAVLKANISLLSSLAEAMGAPIKAYTKKCFIPMLFNLSDKQSLVRDEVVGCMDKWSEAIGSETVVQYACAQLEQENPELREEGLKWILAHKDGIKGADHSIMVKPLVDCLLDKVSKIRQQAEEIIVEVMTMTGFEPFSRVAKDLKTAVQQQVRPILEKAKSKCGSAPAQQNEESKVAPAPKAQPMQPTKRPITAGPTLKQDAPLRSLLDAAKSPTRNTFAVAAQDPARAQTARGTLALSIPSANKDGAGDDEPLIVNAGNKEKRGLLDAKSKWMHEEMKPEQIDKVKHLCEQIYGYEFMQRMFSVDFKKHQGVLKAFSDLITQQPDNLKETLDVIIKWSCIKLTESSNTTFAVAVFDFYQLLIEFLVVDNYQMMEHEAYVFIPLLCDKSGLNNSILKEKVKRLLKQCFSIYEPKKCIQLLFKFGVGAKNLKSVAECLDEITIYVRENGLELITEKDLQLVVKMADSGDKGVREGSLTLIGEIYKIIDEQIWRLLGPINIKVKGLLEGRFKQVKKAGGAIEPMNRSINQATPPERRTMAPQQNPLNRSLVQGGTGQPQATPRKIGVALKQNSGLQSLTKSISKQNQMTTSINSNNGGMGAKQMQSSASVAVIQQPSKIGSARQPLKFQNNVDDGAYRQSEIQKPAGSFLQEFQQSDSRQSMQQPRNMGRNERTVFDDDDEDLIQQLNEIERATQPKEQLDPILKEKMDFVMKHVQSLKYGDLSKRVDSLVALNDIITNIVNYAEAIIRCTNEICSAFTHVLVDVFERPLQDIPLRFAKYFVTIVNRVCSSAEVMNSASEKETYDLAEQLLFRLLTDNLDKLGEAKEGEVILKTLNAAMLRLLENCQPSHIYCALFNLLRKYKEYTVLPKLPGLVIKCLLKLAKIIEKQTSMLEIDKIILAIHEYLLAINHEEKSQNDEMGIRISKTVVNELVKMKGDAIWDQYKLVASHLKADAHIKRWILLILDQPKNLSSSNPLPSFGTQQQLQQTFAAPQKRDDKEIKQIIDELRSTDLFEGAISKLHTYLQRHPEESLNMHLKDLSAHFGNFIRTHLEQYSNSLVETGSTPHGSKMSEPQELIDMSRSAPLSHLSPGFAQRKSTERLQTMSEKQQPRMQNSGLQRPSNIANTGSTGAAINQQQSSDQRISSYQDKLSEMRGKLQRAGSNSNLSVPNQESVSAPVNQVVGPLPSFSLSKQANSQLPRPTTAVAGIKPAGTLNTSFSQMNSSLSQKWSAISKQKQMENQQLNNSGIGGGSRPENGDNQEAAHPNSNKLNSGGDNNSTTVNQPATNGDLQSKLAAMKAKLANLNQKK